MEQWTTIVQLLVVLMLMRIYRQTKARLRKSRKRAKLIGVGLVYQDENGEDVFDGWHFGHWEGPPVTADEEGPKICGWPLKELEEIAQRREEFTVEDEA